jgi:hypothetical protein
MEFVLGLCHQVVVLDYGTVVAVDPPAEVAANPRVLDAYLGAALDDEPARPLPWRIDRTAARRTTPARRRPPGPGPEGSGSWSEALTGGAGE